MDKAPATRSLPKQVPPSKLGSLLYLVNTFLLLALSLWAPSSKKPSLTHHSRDATIPPLDHWSCQAALDTSTSAPGVFTETSTHKATSSKGWELPGE